MAETVPLMVRADLCERIKALAAERGQSIDELLEDLLPPLPDQLAIFDIPSLAVDPHHTGLHLTSRAELYGNDGSQKETPDD